MAPETKANPYVSYETVSTGIARGGVSDRPTENDTLGFGPYVQGVADFLTDEEAARPVTISVEGGWGSGKTSFLLQLQKRLRESGYRTSWFSGWRYEDDQALWAAAVLKLVDSLREELHPLEREWSDIVLRLKRFGVRRGIAGIVLGVVALGLVMAVGWELLMAVAGSTELGPLLTESGRIDVRAALSATGVAGIVLVLVLSLKWLWNQLGNPLAEELRDFVQLPEYARQESVVDEIHRDLEMIVASYAGDSPVVIFVDDLDRAEPVHAARMIRALNRLMEDSSQINYVLALDREKVAAGLAASYKEVLPYLYGAAEAEDTQRMSTRFGMSFLEKFVQLSFAIPRPNPAQIRAMLGGGSGQTDPGSEREPEWGDPLVEITGDEDDDRFRQIVLTVAPSLDYNPRRVKQFTNAFRLQAHIASRTGLFRKEEHSVHEPLTLERLGKWVALQQLRPGLVREMLEDPELLSRLFQKALQSEPGEEDGIDDQLRTLLLLPRTNPGDFSRDDEFVYGMSNLDVEALLTVGSVVEEIAEPEDMEPPPGSEEPPVEKVYAGSEASMSEPLRKA